MRLLDLVETSRGVAGAGGRLEKIERLASMLRRLEPHEVEAAVAFICGELRQGRIGLGPAALRDAVGGDSAETGTLTIAEVDRAFETIAGISGKGSAAERRRLLRGLLGRATRPEQEFLARLLFGELRQGALAGLVAEAVARAAGVHAGGVRRAVMLAGDLRPVAAAVLRRGGAGLDEFALTLLRPVKPMLAQTAETVPEAMRRIGSGAFEWKLDGARIQAHKAGEEVRVFSRSLRDVTAAVPEVVEAVRALPAGEIVLDGEALSLDADGRPLAFQATMRRFGRRLDVERLRREMPLTSYFFDCLHLEGRTLIDRPGEQRFEAMAGCLPAGQLVPRLVTGDAAAAQKFLDEALQRGHEGVMAKSLEAAYEAGARGASWFKIKPVHTLDLVILAAEWGHGRRRGWLSNLHLGARDPATGSFVMLGKTFKGMSDETLDWQTKRLLGLQVATDRSAVYVRPELVAEIAFGDVQSSPQYPAGLALRFARLKRYRTDKRPEEADTIETVRAIHGGARQP